MEKRADGSLWFSELSSFWPGQAFTLQVKKILYEGKTKFQDIIVFDSEQYGRVLVLDGAIQFTEREEFSYHEMIAHVPLHAHAAPKRVLIIGGGDGGALREVLRHSCVREVVLCDIDGDVIDLCKEYFPKLANGAFADPRVTVRVGDGFEYLQEHEGTFDVILADSTDPIGPAQSLFSPRFYELLHRALTSDGIVCCQGECIWLHLDFIADLAARCRSLFSRVEYASAYVPTYPCGQIGFLLLGKSKGSSSLASPVREVDPAGEFASRLRYYSSAVHRAAFVLPEFAAKKLNTQ